MPVNKNEMLITSIQHLAIDDGAGLRTTIFLKGCPLKCPWCCNPETQLKKIEYYLDKQLCSKYKGSRFCFSCNDIMDLNKDCYFNAREKIGKYYTIQQLYEEVKHNGCKDITFSGGEPLLQQKILIELIKLLKLEDYNIAIETSLAVSPSPEIIQYVDEWIIDLKFQYPIYTYIPSFIIPNARFRIVIFTEIINNPTWFNWTIRKMKAFSIRKIELLCYHELGKTKYNKLGRNYKKFTVPSLQDIIELQKEFHINDIQTIFLSI